MERDLGARLTEWFFIATALMVWPAAAVGSAGMLVSAVASAFYYHFGAWAALVGFAPMALTMGLPDDLDPYIRVFHLTAAWFTVTGILAVRSGIKLDAYTA